MTVTWRHSAGLSFLAHVYRVHGSRKRECAAEKLEAAANSEYQKAALEYYSAIALSQLLMHITRHNFM